ncbi:extracellular solute-binding protein [Streptomyces sp. CAI-85]|uniref:ABC transporter substrate-binding protein n=1 Tax=Streptomyces sp. CAI-85 TaxID=1472662 RepID=UPI0015871BCC|nr:extracellular solute-binding protein [Streptomyces sp. CAI-85]MBO7937290.1 extracellular solute-binding protein [Streptomyces sp. S9]NUV64252.1 extracellular solute-binding protein [Streptomyces sp. CAI-85]
MGTSRHVERRTILKAAGAAAATLGLAATTGCGGDGGSGDGTVTLRYAWWGGEPRAIAIKKTIALFEMKHPKIRIKPEFTDYEAFWEKFQTQASGGNPPDVFQNAVGFLRKYDKRGVLMDLKGQADAGNLSLENFRNGVLANGQVDGKQIGIPVGANTMALVIDLKAFQKAGVTPEFGWTWDEYFTALQTIQDKLRIAGDTGYFSIMYLYDLYLRQNGKAFFTDSGLGFTEDDLTQWWEDGYKRVKSGLVADPKKVEQVKPKSALSAGLAASEFTWDNFSIRYEGEGESDYGLAPIPTGDGKDTGQYLGSLMLSAFSGTKHPEEAARFIDFMVHDPEVGAIMGYDRGILATTEQYDAFTPTDDNNKGVKAYEEEVAAAGALGKITPHPSGADVVEAAFLRIGGEVAQGKSKPADAAKALFSEAKAAFAG